MCVFVNRIKAAPCLLYPVPSLLQASGDFFRQQRQEPSHDGDWQFTTACKRRKPPTGVGSYLHNFKSP